MWRHTITKQRENWVELTSTEAVGTRNERKKSKEIKFTKRRKEIDLGGIKSILLYDEIRMVKPRPVKGNFRHIRRNAVSHNDSCAGKKIEKIIFPA